MKSRMASIVFFFAPAALFLCGCATQGLTSSQRMFWNGAQPVAEGILLEKLELDEPRLMKAYVMRVDLATKGLAFTGTGRDENWGKQMPDYTNRVCLIDTRRERTADFVRRMRAPVEEGGRGLDLVAAFNTEPWGPFESPWTHKYANVYSPMYCDGEVVSKKAFGKGAIFVVWKNGDADIVGEITEAQTNDVWIAHTGFNIIMRQGEDICKPGGSLAPRTAVGLSANRRWLFLLVVDGRQEEWSLGADMHDLVDILRRAGAYDAMNMDGGGSSTLVYWDENLGLPIVCNRHNESGATRSVAANVGIYFKERPRKARK